jgi:beta-lactamase superfamily II metal-dependent hydrolase
VTGRLVTFFLLFLAWASASGTQELLLRIRFFDVGQGDGVLIQSPSGQNVVYDAGEHPTRMRDYLTALSVSQVGLVIASHNHADHIGGLADVVRAFRPPLYMDNGLPSTTLTYRRLLEAVSEVGSQLVEPTSRRILLGDVSLGVVPPPGIAHWEQNDNSVGVVVEYGGFRLSLTGDAEPREWAWWLVNRKDLFPAVDVHKASHHGSIHGDIAAGLARLAPKTIVVSSGAENGYGHPDREALRLYADQRATVYRTDLHGTIVVEAERSGHYTIRLERTSGTELPAFVPPTAPIPLPAPIPTPVSSSIPSPLPNSWVGSPPPRTLGGHPVCQVPLPPLAACVSNVVGSPQAVCDDATFSCSTGSGTCSGHGGVYCWRN